MQVFNLQQVSHPEVRQLLAGRDYPGIEVQVVVLEPGDTLAAAGYSEEDSEYAAQALRVLVHAHSGTSAPNRQNSIDCTSSRLKKLAQKRAANFARHR